MTVEPWILLIAAVTLLLTLILFRVPIAVALGVTGMLGLWLRVGWSGMFEAVRFYPYTMVAAWTLAPVPLFIIMGYFADVGGVTERAFATAYKWVGRLPAGLAQATTVACAMFGACSGSSSATAGTMGKVCIPEMLKYGYDKRLAAGAAAAGGLLAIMIPPSMIMVIYASVTEVSVGKLLIAGILPGILTVIVYGIGLALWVRLRPDAAPRGPRIGWGERFKSIKDVWGVLILAAVIMGGIYGGVFTATEAAAVGAFAALLIAFTAGRKAVKRVIKAVEETASTTSMILFLIVGSTLFGFFLNMSGVPQWVARTVLSLSLPTWGVLVIIILMYVMLGMILDSISMLLVTLPIVFPIIRSLGFDGIWFGIIATQLAEIGMITPPVAANLFVISAVAPPEMSFEDVVAGAMPFLAMQVVTLTLLVIFPQIALFLPSLMK